MTHTKHVISAPTELREIKEINIGDKYPPVSCALFNYLICLHPLILQLIKSV